MKLKIPTEKDLEKWASDALATYKCEICGEQATCIVVDVIEILYKSGVVRPEKYGPTHKFCAKHARDSRYIKLDGEISSNQRITNER